MVWRRGDSARVYHHPVMSESPGVTAALRARKNGQRPPPRVETEAMPEAHSKTPRRKRTVMAEAKELQTIIRTEGGEHEVVSACKQATSFEAKGCTH